jgi:HAD superfamily hydrolase (TIGR01509 family)
MIRALLFDLDNTLVDSRLDFEAMRREMRLPSDLPILEAIDRLPPREAERCRTILHRHELAGAACATLLPGVRSLLDELSRRGLPFGIATRNSHSIAAATLANVGVACELVLTRDCGPVKPDPWAVHHACRTWNVAPSNVVFVGDYRFDIEAGRAAGARTVLLTHAPDPHLHANAEGADLVLSSLAEYPRLLAWIDRHGHLFDRQVC